MKKINFISLIVLLISSVLISCNTCTPEDYISDLKELTEETAKNASSYTKNDWEEVVEKFKKITKKGEKACKNLSEEQAKEIKKLKNKLKKKIANFDSEALERDKIESLSEE